MPRVLVGAALFLSMGSVVSLAATCIGLRVRARGCRRSLALFFQLSLPLGLLLGLLLALSLLLTLYLLLALCLLLRLLLAL